MTDPVRQSDLRNDNLPGSSGAGATNGPEDASLHNDFNRASAPNVRDLAVGHHEEPTNVIHLGDSSPNDSEEYRYGEANRRQRVLETFTSLVNQDKTKKEAARLCGESETTIWRWRKAFAKSGFKGLLPDTDKCGRKSALEKLGISQDVIDLMRGYALDTNVTTAARLFARSEQCAPELASVILDPTRSSKHALPPSIRRAITVNPAERLAHRGTRALSLKGIYTPRKLDILPGDIFTSDDTTPIWAWWVPWVTSEEYPFGVKLMQGQFLPVIDVASQMPLTFALIAREKSSYRASDIWALFGHTFDQVGVPRLGWQLERGSWEANMIAGQEVAYERDEVTMSRRVGGLRQLPTNPTEWHQRTMGEEFKCFPRTLQTWTSYLPKSKSIEAFFNRSQTLEGMLWGSLGRDQMRKPFEKMKKLYQECGRKGSKLDPRQYFLSQEEMTARLKQLFEYLGSETMEGEVFSGVPRQKWDIAMAEYPLLPLPEDDRWLYMRDWKTVQITQGWARLRLTHEISGERYSLFYTNPAVFARHEGEEVIVYYDREKFDVPAQIILARTGEYLCEANYVDRVGSFISGDRSGHDIRKEWRNAVITSYATIVKHAPSRQLPPEISARREGSRHIAPAPAAPSTTTVARIPITRKPDDCKIDAATLQRRREQIDEEAEHARQLLVRPDE